ncbi:GNAT family N-acetyltransferase [Streptomyces sp. V1I1]|uniref:GNAT family N-acetyltransferase n=1 Tax=Streptomyces sp. V1I1 TaxID=3042272 RepID=UPI0027D91B0D|nr:GNAT family N-acetyltransferase [Streptomyces sp. V1I1]
MEPITLTTERLLLRTFTTDDTEAVYQACQDPDIQRWTTVPSPYERQHAADFTGQMVPDGWHSGTMCTFAVLPRAGGPLMASVAVTLRTLSGTWEIGFWTAKEHRGRGIMAETVGAVAHWAFAGLGATRLEWRAEVGNAGSRAVAEKAGFVVEGALRAALLNKDTLRDTWVGALLPSDLGLTSTHPYLPTRS